MCVSSTEYDCSLKTLICHGENHGLDPHFCEHKCCISPFARLEPTEAGWTLGLKMLDEVWG